MVNFRPFGEGYAATAIDVRSGYVAPTKGPNFEAPLADDKFLAAVAIAARSQRAHRLVRQQHRAFAQGHAALDESLAQRAEAAEIGRRADDQAAQLRVAKLGEESVEIVFGNRWGPTGV
jgi:hypothetical protein